MDIYKFNSNLLKKFKRSIPQLKYNIYHYNFKYHHYKNGIGMDYNLIKYFRKCSNFNYFSQFDTT